jgi:hypothetical protein
MSESTIPTITLPECDLIDAVNALGYLNESLAQLKELFTAIEKAGHPYSVKHLAALGAAHAENIECFSDSSLEDLAKFSPERRIN